MLGRRAREIARHDIGGKDSLDLAVLSGSGTRLGCAIHKAQCYLTDEELSREIERRSKTVFLTVVNDELAFLDAALIVQVTSGLSVLPIRHTERTAVLGGRERSGRSLVSHRTSQACSTADQIRFATTVPSKLNKLY